MTRNGRMRLRKSDAEGVREYRHCEPRRDSDMADPDHGDESLMRGEGTDMAYGRDSDDGRAEEEKVSIAEGILPTGARFIGGAGKARKCGQRWRRRWDAGSKKSRESFMLRVWKI